jgi:CHASE2 domain-containing sensor protein
VKKRILSLVKWVGEHRRAIATLFVLPFLLFSAYSFRLLNVGGVSNAVEDQYVALVTHTVQKTLSRDIRLIYMDEENNKSLLEENRELTGFMVDDIRRQQWRKLHAKLITKLEAAGVSAIAFDFTFPVADNSAKVADQAFVKTVRDVTGRGRTQIIVGTNSSQPTEDDLQRISLLEQGGVEVGGISADTSTHRSLRRVLVASSEGRSANGTIDEHLMAPLPMPLSLLMCARRVPKRLISAGIGGSQDEVVLYQDGQPIQHIRAEMGFCKAGSQNCEVSNGFEWRRSAVLPLLMPAINENETPYQDVLSASTLPEYKDKIVIIGARLNQEKVSLPNADPSTQFYGYQVHAAILDDLLHDAYPRSPTTSWQLLVFFLLAGFALIGRRVLPVKEIKINTMILGEREVPIGLLILFLIYLVAGVVVFSFAHVVLNVAYDLALLAAAYYICGASGPAQPEPAKESAT